MKRADKNLLMPGSHTLLNAWNTAFNWTDDGLSRASINTFSDNILLRQQEHDHQNAVFLTVAFRLLPARCGEED